MEFRWRKSEFEKGDRVYRLTGDALEMEKPDGIVVSIPLSDVKTIRLEWAPTQLKPNRHVLTVTSRQKVTIAFDNLHYVRVSTFEDRSTAFSEFSRFLIDEVRRASPSAQLKYGASPGSYALQLSVGLFGLAVVAIGLVLFPLPFEDWPIAAIVKLGVFAILLPFFLRWMLKSRPRTIPMNDVPDDIFPAPMVPVKAGHPATHGNQNTFSDL